MPGDLALLENAAGKLKGLLNEVVFLGGATLALMVTDEGSAPARPTLDVDVIVEITNYWDYVDFSKRLRKIGFSEDTREDAPTCRWLHGDLTLDVMPLDKSVLGYENIWYKGALETSWRASLPSGTTIRVATAPYFLGTKMEAFRSRGKRDFFASHDLEDFIAVVEGRDSLLDEIEAAPVDLRTYLGQAARELLAEESFQDALPGYLLGDAISQKRVPIVLRRLAGMGSTESERA